MTLMKKRFVIAAVAVFLIVGSFAGGFFVATKVEKSYGYPSILSTNAASSSAQDIDLAPFWKTWKTINELYIGDMPTNQEKVYGATAGLVSSLNDPYSVFFPPRESEYFASEIRGDFQGVGIEIEVRDGVLTVVSPLKGTPADKAGVKPGDKIIKIDDKSTADLSVNESVDLIRGPKGSTVTLTVVREGAAQAIDIPIVRDTINLPVIETEKREADKVFIIRLYSFSAPSADKFREALREFVALSISEGYHKLILDLRNNPGGFLEAAVDMASWFLPAGKVVVKEDFGTKAEGQIYRSRGYNIFNDNLQFVILVNRGSASASEILAGALKQQGKATLIGERTFGKGTVQQLVDITPDTSLKITVARWLLPNGDTISKEGVEPDIEAIISDEDAKNHTDSQLQAALDYLSKRP